MTYEERLEAIEKKKAELENLKKSLNQCSSTDYSFEEKKEDSYTSNEQGYSL